MLFPFLFGDVSYRWDNLSSVQLRLLIFKDVRIKSSKFFVIFRVFLIFGIVSCGIWVTHLRNGVLLDRNKWSFILSLRYRIFLCLFLSDLIAIPFWRSKSFGQLDRLLKRTLLHMFPADFLSHAFTEWLRVDLKEWILVF